MHEFFEYIFDAFIPIFVNNSDFFIFLLIIIVFMLLSNIFNIFRG